MDFLEVIGFKGLHISLAAEPLFHIGPVTITNTIFTAWIVMALLVIASFLATRKMQLVPSGLQNFAEAIVEMLYDIVEGGLGRPRTQNFPHHCHVLHLHRGCELDGFATGVQQHWRVGARCGGS